MHIYIYIYIYIYIHYVSFKAGFSLVETPFPRVNLFQVNKKDTRTTLSKPFWSLMGRF